MKLIYTLALFVVIPCTAALAAYRAAVEAGAQGVQILRDVWDS